MTQLYNDFGMVEVVHDGDLSDRFIRVRFMDAHLAYLNKKDKTDYGYLVFADTMQYRRDGEHHALDVSENNERGRQAHEADVRAYIHSFDD
ncbi:hypothetical protein [Rhizobium ruizarguesonis]|uniref:hypothetical protein n=1 Tax=Rhizobium ruizarguesonis TaxID=2081791 RepID=UPI0010301A8C|nr:hypothetical protein [Rhizobium ruizarguesonis]TBD81031.1 hypothetical protein ELH11_14570 [Rhizobium ruizarguesonis]TBE12191.1 hypothetical protein ELH09_14650 [Rhizobium ruizarguesonis]WSH32150.1 hypothetical protein U8P70_16495 [Rhizobium ruizarguesonis]